MTTRLENTIRISIPEIRTELEKLPAPNGKIGAEFLRCYNRELAYCITRALRAPEGQVVFSDLRIPRQENGQYIMEFEVFDRSKARGNSYNWHGQNTSQWVYAGCILYQEGSVSTHH